MEGNHFVVYVTMILVQFANSGMAILIKLALNQGMNQFVFMVYRFILAAIILTPFAYLSERKHRPALSLIVMMKIFGLASLGITLHLNLFYIGLRLTSPTVASALYNASPCVTFLMAALLGVEKVKLRSKSSRAKVLGTLTCLSGSLIFTLWRGINLLNIFKTPLINSPISSGNNNHLSTHGKQDWIKGSFLILISLFGWSAWIISQVRLCKIYPAILSLNTIACFSASIESFLLALFFSRDIELWRIQWNAQLLAIVYCGLLTAVVNLTLTWCIRIRGPVFTTTFTPLQLIIVAVFSAVAFAEQIHLGSLVGAVIIIAGMYCFLWGKKMEGNIKDERRDSTVEKPESHDPEAGQESLRKNERNGINNNQTTTSKDVAITS